jgi:putative transcriptional regulator
LQARTRTRELTLPEVRVDAPPRYTSMRIRSTRMKLGYSQPVFAKTLNVSVQTVRAWEQGTRTPDGPTRRLLELAEEVPEVFARKVHPLVAD